MTTVTLPKVNFGTVYKGSPSGRVVKAQGETVELQPNEVVVEIAYTGICGSDLHFLTRDIVLGHEGVGIISQVGHSVKNVKVEDRVGWGLNHYSCNYCDQCLCGNDHMCPERRMYSMADGHIGCFSDRVVINSYFVHVIPGEIKLVDAGPLQCGGATVYGAIVNAGIRSPDRVGVVGIGGLGHLAIQYLAKMGCAVVVFSSTNSKKEQAMQLGATEFVATKENPSLRDIAPLDSLVVSTSVQPDWSIYVNIVKQRGTVLPLSLSHDDLKLPYVPLLMKELRIIGSFVANRYYHREMIRFAAEHGVRPIVEVLPMTEDSINDAMERLSKGDVRYRFVIKSQTTDAE